MRDRQSVVDRFQRGGRKVPLRPTNDAGGEPPVGLLFELDLTRRA